MSARTFTVARWITADVLSPPAPVATFALSNPNTQPGVPVANVTPPFDRSTYTSRCRTVPAPYACPASNNTFHPELTTVSDAYDTPGPGTAIHRPASVDTPSGPYVSASNPITWPGERQP